MTHLLTLLALLPTTLYAEPTDVIHLLNYHYVTPEVFATDLKDQDSTLTQEQIDKRYAQFIRRVESIQRDQVIILRRMIKKHKLKGIYIEGLTEKNHGKTIETIESIKKDKKEKDEFFKSVLSVVNETNLLQLGAAGQLVAKGELETLYVTEDSKAFEAANPVRDDGKIVFDKEADERREDAIVRNLLKESGVVVIVLGKDYDLRDNLKRLAKGVKYKRVLPITFKSGQRLDSKPRLIIRKVGE